MSQELANCTFCGGQPVYEVPQDEDLWSHNIAEWRRVRCPQCEIGTDYICDGYEPDAIAAWNQRAQPAGAAEPIYQCMCTDDDQSDRHGADKVWMDVSRDAYEQLSKRADVRSRIVYAAPPAAANQAGIPEGWLRGWIDERRRLSFNLELYAHETANINLFLDELEKAWRAVRA